MESSTPAETAEPITPATFGPIACISKKFPGSAFCPSTCDTRAAIGTADTPAEPIRGLILSLKNLFITFASKMPEAVPMAKATTPSARIASVFGVRKFSAVAVAPTVVPRKMVTILISAFWAVSSRRAVTPLSRKRLPSISMPIRELAAGTTRVTTMVTITTTMNRHLFSRMLNIVI